jgi:DNA-binding IclR family transcriptional regulator
VAVHDERARPFAALSLSGPAGRLTARHVVELGDLVGRAASGLTRDLGGEAPLPAPPSPAAA